MQVYIQALWSIVADALNENVAGMIVGVKKRFIVGSRQQLRDRCREGTVIHTRAKTIDVCEFFR
ncbi:MAG: hypothetical protein DHS20C16_16280 [Phycisphaerae bacterium]|nr:MAG: hypothetical protein DHS20C16_16280 [Phycisphaerae bacterium]